MVPNTTSKSFFDAKYLRDPDPWKFSSSPYERARYGDIIVALGHRRYERAFEPGCSIGVLTQRLAAICKHVDAADISPTALELARERCSGLANVDFKCYDLAALLPTECFDLIVLSEIGYYFDEGSLRTLANNLLHRLRKGGIFLAAHWLGTSSDHVISGDRVHDILGSLTGLQLQYSKRHDGFRLDRWAHL